MKGNAASLEAAVEIEAGDGIWFNGGHIGFARNDVQIRPLINNTGVQGVYFSSTYLDGNFQGENGLYIPLFSSLAGSSGRYVQSIVFSGAGTVANHIKNGILSEDDQTGILNVDGQIIANNNSHCISVRGNNISIQNNTLLNCGSAIKGGGILLRAQLDASVQNNRFINTFRCLDVKSKGVLQKNGNSFDHFCQEMSK